MAIDIDLKTIILCSCNTMNNIGQKGNTNSIALFCHATTKMRHFLLLDLRGNLPGLYVYMDLDLNPYIQY